jgi:hypothetical protein
MPCFNYVKIYHNCVLRRKEYQELRCRTPIKHRVWQTTKSLSRVCTSRIAATEQEPATVEQADMVMARKRYRKGNKVGTRRPIPADDELLQCCRPFNVITGPHKSFNLDMSFPISMAGLASRSISKTITDRYNFNGKMLRSIRAEKIFRKIPSESAS